MLRIVSPTQGQVIREDHVTVKMTLRGAQLVPKVTLNITPDKGHLHMTLDGRPLDRKDVLAYPISDLAPGSHIVTAQFVASDHAPFNPQVITSVTFVVR